MRSFIRVAAACLTIGVMLGIPAAAQSAPTNVQATANGPTNVSLTWVAGNGAVGYVVQRAVGGTPFARLSDRFFATSYTDATAPAGTAIHYRIRAIFANGRDAFSAVASVTTPSATSASNPPPPSTPPASNTGSTATSTTPPSGSTPVQRQGGAPTVATLGATNPEAAPRAYATADAAARAGKALTAVQIPSSPAAPTTSSPGGSDPAGFTAMLQGDTVRLSWQAVPGVLTYLLGGPAMGQNGQRIQTTSYAIGGLGVGSYQWTVASLSDAGPPLNNWTKWPKAALTISPEDIHSGRYRVTLNGFTVNRETLDHQFQTDGAQDEVYLAAQVTKYDKNGPVRIEERVVKSLTYGDEKGYPLRIQAGTATGTGGLTGGDNYPNQPDPWRRSDLPRINQLPLLLWEGDLVSGESVLLITPTIWEWDGDQRAFNWWSSGELKTGDSKTLTQERLETGVFDGLLGRKDIHPFEFPRDGLRTVTELGNAPRSMENADRPIGMRKNPSWPDGYFPELQPKELALTVAGVEAALQNSSTFGGRGPGMIEVRYQDQEAWMGDYTLYLQVERIQ
jgi:hypothetical protein